MQPGPGEDIDPEVPPLTMTAVPLVPAELPPLLPPGEVAPLPREP
jgi:hypothetical protein